MFAEKKAPARSVSPSSSENGKPMMSITLLTVVGPHARMEGKFDIDDSIQIECEVGGQLVIGGKLVIGERGVVKANVQTVDAVIMGHYEGNMIATGDVEIAETGRVTGNIQTDSLVISKGGVFNGNVTKMKDDAARQLIAVVPKRSAPSARHDAAPGQWDGGHAVEKERPAFSPGARTRDHQRGDARVGASAEPGRSKSGPWDGGSANSKFSDAGPSDPVEEPLVESRSTLREGTDGELLPPSR